MRTAWQIILLVFGFGVGSLLAADAQTVAPLDRLQPFSTQGIAMGQVRATAANHLMSLDGRELGVMEGLIDGGVTDRVSVGLLGKTSAGHGRTGGRYDADGWGVWSKAVLICGQERRPSLAVLGEYLTEDTIVQYNSSSMNFYAAPTYASSGGQALLSGGWRSTLWHARTGLYLVNVMQQRIATVTLLGAGMKIPLARCWETDWAVTGYGDNFDGQNLNYEIRGALQFNIPNRGGIVVAGSLFPEGFPLAATPFSTAAAVGSFFGGSATSSFRAQKMGYLSVAGQFAF